MIILHPWVRGVRPADQAFCWSALAGAEAAGFTVEHLELPATDPFAYARGLRRVWGRDALLVIEHDVEPSLALLEALRDCPEDLCTRLYDGQQPVTGVTHLGCTKFSLRCQTELPCPALGSMEYTGLDVEVTGFCAYWLHQNWHCHTEPLEHHHARPAWHPQRDAPWHAIGGVVGS